MERNRSPCAILGAQQKQDSGALLYANCLFAIAQVLKREDPARTETVGTETVPPIPTKITSSDRASLLGQGRRMRVIKKHPWLSVTPLLLLATFLPWKGMAQARDGSCVPATFMGCLPSLSALYGHARRWNVGRDRAYKHLHSVWCGCREDKTRASAAAQANCERVGARVKMAQGVEDGTLESAGRLGRKDLRRMEGEWGMPWIG